MFLSFGSTLFGLFAYYKNSISGNKYDMTGYVLMAVCSTLSTLFLILFGTLLNFKSNQLRATLRKCISRSDSKIAGSYLRDFAEEVESKAIQINMAIFPLDCRITFDVIRVLCYIELIN